MKAGILQSKELFSVKQVPEPQLEKGSVLVKISVCSVCSTDIRIYRHGHPRIELPQILGHEIAGTVAAVADGIADYRVGDRVVITPRIACGRCAYCREGQYSYCEQSRTFGYQLPGGYAEYVLVPHRGVEFGVINRIPPALGFNEASLAEPLSCALRGQRLSRFGAGDTLVVIGGGPLGIMHCRVARASGAARVVLVESDTGRLEHLDLSSVDEVIDSAKRDPKAAVAALTGGRGADVTIVACSSTEAQKEAFSFAGKGGRINFFGGLPAGESNVTIDSNVIHYREVVVLGSHGSTPQDHREALDMLATGKLAVGDLLSHFFPLDSIQEAFRFAESRQGMHVAINP